MIDKIGHDMLGQPLEIGDNVIYVSIVHSSLRKHVGTITRFTPKMVGIKYDGMWHDSDDTLACSYNMIKISKEDFAHYKLTRK